MKSEAEDLAQVMGALDSLRQDVAGLNERVVALETAGAARPAAMATAPTQADEIGEELVLVISAAIAAFLGVKPHIRQIRLLGSASWAQQGRATIQASHALTVHHG